MRAIHLFNPGYEAAVLSGQVRYTPPTNVQVMRRDLCALPLWYAERGDLVWCTQVVSPASYTALPLSIRPLAAALINEGLYQQLETAAIWKACPWGLSPDSLYQFKTLTKSVKTTLKDTEWKADYRRLTGRQTAAVCLDRLRKELSSVEWPQVPIFCSSLEEVNTCITPGEGPYLLKTPFSSSGRGLLWCTNALSEKEMAWAEGAIRKQGEVSVERGLNKVLDFALEFQVNDAGEVCYEGLSLFETAERGAYLGNRLASEEILRQAILSYVNESLFEQVRQLLQQLLKELYAPFYQGYIGVDMLIYRTESGAYAWHPCVEINMRYTMGLVALRLTQRLLAPEATGIFCITYHKQSGEALQSHQQAQLNHPLCYANDRISRGYLSLCPVTSDTHYRAYLLIS